MNKAPTSSNILLAFSWYDIVLEEIKVTLTWNHSYTFHHFGNHSYTFHHFFYIESLTRLFTKASQTRMFRQSWFGQVSKKCNSWYQLNEGLNRGDVPVSRLNVKLNRVTCNWAYVKFAVHRLSWSREWTGGMNHCTGQMHQKFVFLTNHEPVAWHLETLEFKVFSQ